jgi:hypothetical protein
VSNIKKKKIVHAKQQKHSHSGLFAYLKEPPDAVRITLLSAPSGNPWIH